MEGQLQIDDIDYGGNVMEKKDIPNFVYSIGSFATSDKHVKPFMFAPLKLTGECLQNKKIQT